MALSPGLGWSLIQTQTASASATLDFAGLTGFASYAIVLRNVYPVTDNTVPYMRVSSDNGSSFKSGGSDYKHTTYRASSAAASFAGSTADSEVEVTGTGISNDATYEGLSGAIMTSDLSRAKYARFWWHVSQHEGGTGNHNVVVGSGIHIGTAVAINAVRFLFSSGNIAGGTISTYGIK